jgi:hypothetical protein
MNSIFDQKFGTKNECFQAFFELVFL